MAVADWIRNDEFNETALIQMYDERGIDYISVWKETSGEKGKKEACNWICCLLLLLFLLLHGPASPT